MKAKLKLTLEELGRARSLLDEKTEKCAAVLDLETQLEENESQLVTITHQYETSQVEVRFVSEVILILNSVKSTHHHSACKNLHGSMPVFSTRCPDSKNQHEQLVRKSYLVQRKFSLLDVLIE